MSDDKFEHLAESIDRAMHLMMERCEQIQEQLNHYAGLSPSRTQSHRGLSTAGKIDALAPIEHLLADDKINDILINGYDDIFIERGGKLEKTEAKFASEEALWNAAKEIAVRCGRYLDPDRPILDARLDNGSRVNIISPPLTLDGTIISIRKFATQAIDLDNLASMDAMSQQMADYLKICAAMRVSILIVGGTGAGKTTLLNAVSQYIPPDQRVVTIEDSAELRLPIPHIVRLESKPYVHGTPAYSEVTIRDLVKNALRMRPDRIIVGETRGPEAFDMIQAMNTGHHGSMTTIHANTSRDGLVRMENLIGLATPNMAPKSVRQMISSAVNLIVQIQRMRDGTRRITNITEITGMEGDTIVAQELFQFVDKGEDEQGNVKGEYKSTGIMPRLMNAAIKNGYREPMQRIFNARF